METVVKSSKLLLFVSTVIAVVLSSCQTDKSEKEFILNNSSKMQKVSENSFVVENLEGYYTAKSIYFHGDSSYTIVCWG